MCWLLGEKIMSIVLIEPAIVPDVYICGLVRPEDLGNGDWRYTGYTRLGTPDGGMQCVVNSRLIVPTTVILQSIKDTMKALGMACCGAERLNLRH